MAEAGQLYLLLTEMESLLYEPNTGTIYSWIIPIFK
jgi:hypothetical protein